MNRDEFWRIIDAAHAAAPSSMDLKIESLRRLLGELTDSDLSDFGEFFVAAKAQSYTWPLSGAAYVINAGCSDDSFDDFRAALISYGEQRFMSALRDPDSLAEILPNEAGNLFHEGYQYVFGDEMESLHTYVTISTCVDIKYTREVTC